MTFQEWADNLSLDEPDSRSPSADNLRRAWRCDGPCGKMMHGIARIKGWNYPTDKIPAGSHINPDYERVCEVCWALYSNLAERSYWVNMAARDKRAYHRLKPEGDFLT